MENPEKHLENPIICSLSREIHNGINKFMFIWRCGCVMEQEAFESSQESDLGKGVCPLCGEKYRETDIISLWDSPEEIERKKRLMFEINISKKLKKASSKTLGKRELMDQLPEYAKNPKKIKIQEKPHVNILDSIANADYDKKLYKSLFHKETKVDGQKGLFFRNVRFGIR